MLVIHDVTVSNRDAVCNRSRPQRRGPPLRSEWLAARRPAEEPGGDDAGGDDVDDVPDQHPALEEAGAHGAVFGGGGHGDQAVALVVGIRS